MRKFFFLLALVTLPACNLKPPPIYPEVDPPCKWRQETNLSSTDYNWKWWQQFKDPVLDALIVESLKNNRDLKVAIARIFEFAARLGVARSKLFPEVDGNYQQIRQELSNAFSPPPPGISRENTFYYMFASASYEVDLWGRIRNMNEVALQELLAEEEAQQTVVLTLVTNVANAYLILLQYDRQLEISIETLESRKESLKLAVARYEGGQIAELEVKQAEAEMENAEVQVVQFQTLIVQQENLISVLVGSPPTDIIRGRKLSELWLPPCVPTGLPSELLFQRPDLRRAFHDLAAATANIGIERANLFPTFSLTGLLGSESLDLKSFLSGDARTWQLGFTLFQPLFTAGRLQSLIDVSEAQERQILYRYEQAILTAFREVEDALIGHQQSKKLLIIEKRRVQVLRDYLFLATLQYNEGETDYLNVLDAERNLFAAQLDYAEAQAETFTTFIDLYRALGGGWVIDANEEYVFGNNPPLCEQDTPNDND